MAGLPVIDGTLRLRLFSDGSVNTKLKVGYGAYLLVAEEASIEETSKDTVKVKRFEQTSSTQLELQTLLWAVNEAHTFTNGQPFRLTVYTDSQNIIGLPERQARLEQSQYLSAKNKPLHHADLYQAFFRLHESVPFKLHKVDGHKKNSQKDGIDKLFTLVDQASRRALRKEFTDN